MKLNIARNFVMAGLLGISAQPVLAKEQVATAPAAESKLQAAYEEAMQAAEVEREAALAAVARVRAEMERGKVQEKAERARSEAETLHMREKLSRAHEELRRASREVARVHRELERREAGWAPFPGFGDQAVIGVILGNGNDNGIRVLGVSPDGPAERAGIRQGDIIVSVKGEPLTGGNEKPMDMLLNFLSGIEAGDELDLAVIRDGKEEVFTVTAENRQPFSWQSMIRLPSVPSAPDAKVIVDSIDIPELDTEALEQKMQRLHEDLERARIVIRKERRHQDENDSEVRVWSRSFEQLSDLGEDAMMGADIWLGMPMTRGLKLAEVNEELGAYFKTDRGVLVLKVKKDNDLRLRAGDVILRAGDTDVNKPVDLMRVLRGLDAGTKLELEIKRNRKNRTLEVEVPDTRLGLLFGPKMHREYHIDIETAHR